MSTVINMEVPWSILGAFAKLWKATVASRLSVHPPIRPEQLVSQLTNFHE
jgi:hypothetical protein